MPVFGFNETYPRWVSKTLAKLKEKLASHAKDTILQLEGHRVRIMQDKTPLQSPSQRKVRRSIRCGYTKRHRLLHSWICNNLELKDCPCCQLRTDSGNWSRYGERYQDYRHIGFEGARTHFLGQRQNGLGSWLGQQVWYESLGTKAYIAWGSIISSREDDIKG